MPAPKLGADPRAWGLPFDSVEVVDDAADGRPGRSRYAKHFRNRDGSYTAVVTMHPLHRRGQTGRLEDIAEVVEERAATMGGQAFDFVADKIAGRIGWKRTARGAVRVELEDVGAVQIRAVGVAAVAGVVEDGGIVYRAAWADVDWRMRAQAAGLKSDLVLLSPAARREFRFDVTPLQGLDLVDDDGRVVWVRAGEDEPVAAFSAPFLVDAAGEVGPASVRLDGGQLVYSADEAWLDDPERAWPVTLDPTTVFQPSTLDTYVRQDSATSSFGSEVQMGVGFSGTGNTREYRQLCQFSIGSIPSNAIVSSAVLGLTITSNNIGPVTMDVAAQRVTSSWGESTTWNTQPSATSADQHQITVQRSEGAGTVKNFTVTAIVSGWVSGSFSNFGFRIIQAIFVDNSLLWFATRENGTAANRPKLTVTYNTPPGAPTVTAPNGGEVWDAVHTITWNASTDPDGDALTYDIELTTNGGTSWTSLYTGVSGTSKQHDFSASPASATCRIRIRSKDPGGLTSAWDESNANFEIRHNDPPNSPGLVSLGGASNGGVADLAGSVLADWTFSDPDAGDTQSAWAFRRKIGAGAYEYWNATTGAWVAAIVWNAGTSDSYTFPAASWANGNTYNWSVATKDAQGVEGPFATDYTVIGDEPPAATITAPPTTVTDTTRPVTQWTFFDPAGDTQAQFEVKIFDQAEYGAGGFDPGTATPGQAGRTSGIVTSTTARAWQPTIDLLNGGQYRTYLRVKDSDGSWSPWVFQTFTLALTPPEAPTLAVDAEADLGRVELVVTGTHDPVEFPDTTYTIERSLDAGATWEIVRDGDGLVPGVGLQAVAYDYEAPPNVETLYRATTVAEVGGQLIASDPSATAAATLTVSRWWIKLPTSPASNATVHMAVVGSSRDVRASAFQPLDRATAVVVTQDTAAGETVDVEVSCPDTAAWDALEAFVTARATLLLVSPYGWQRYGRLTGRRDAEHQLDGHHDTPARVWRGTFTETEAP